MIAKRRFPDAAERRPGHEGPGHVQAAASSDSLSAGGAALVPRSTR